MQRFVFYFAFGLAAAAFVTVQGFVLEHEVVIKALSN